jgi:hypothetical protein
MALHRSAQGKMVDMTKLARQNELTQAVSNVKMNARGDQLGSNGAIVKRREEVVSSYYSTPAKKVAEPVTEAPVKQAPSADTAPDVVPGIKPSKTQPAKSEE